MRTACPSFRPSSQIGYQTRSAKRADVGATGVQQHDVDVGLEAELGAAVAPDGDQRDAAGAALGLGVREELREPAVDEVAVGPAQRPPDEGAVALERRPSGRQSHAPVWQVRCTVRSSRRAAGRRCGSDPRWSQNGGA